MSSATQPPPSALPPLAAAFSPTDLANFAPLFAPALEYMVDAAQRTVLFWDVMRQRGDQYRESQAKTAPHVLDYGAVLLLDGRTLERPVNYALVRIVPPDGIEIDDRRRPFVIVDPRAGHGPGIGGFKADSEIGVALRAGHPCYFVGFLPHPVPGQTIEDVALAEAVFLEKVIALHPDSDGKPAVIGNCQAGWALMILAAMRPELFGPLIVAGSPLAYWAGVQGANPMRYSGGLLGGSWLAALFSDLGDGIFDGAWLVQNFESLDPANTLWSKQYNLYAKVDSEAERYLGFERWWGAHVYLTRDEIQFITDQLFIGNKLAAGRIQSSKGMAVDLRNIRTPILVFCSKADNITPPQQALGWILALYDSVEDIQGCGQTIVYTLHESAGHLGIFVSGGVARKEHDEFASNIDLIDLLPPGLYEARFERKSADTRNPELAHGQWIMRCEPRTLADIRALGGFDEADDLRFAAVARVSEANLALYRLLAQPMVRALANPTLADWMRRMHPLRLSYELFSSENPFFLPIKTAAERVRSERRPAAADNPVIQWQEALSQQVAAALEGWGKTRDQLAEWLFTSIYGAPLLQALVGSNPAEARAMTKAPVSVLSRTLLRSRIAELKARMANGGLREAAVRCLIYVGMARGGIDERGLAALRRLRPIQQGIEPMTLQAFKAMVREEYLLLLIDPEAAIAAIPHMLPPDSRARQAAYAAVWQVLSASGEITGEAAARLDLVGKLLGAEGAAVPVESAGPESEAAQAKAS
jgi:hypothetical protein